MRAGPRIARLAVMALLGALLCASAYLVDARAIDDDCIPVIRVLSNGDPATTTARCGSLSTGSAHSDAAPVPETPF